MKKIVFVMSLFVFAVSGWVMSAEAAQYDLKTMTPEVTQAISNRQGRYEELQSLKTKGDVGENNHGYVEVLNSASGIQSLVDLENQDRKVIYQTIAEQNNLGPSGFAIIETVFGEVQRDKARAGESIQNPDGAWVKK
ncbi:MAG: YdbL family protein [Candidatus Omnitrophica bacterium]|nr:YdbL family protein [Candidatus Omnitrophota bacterium]